MVILNTVTIQDKDHMEQYLNDLNTAGRYPSVIGVARNMQPFMAEIINDELHIDVMFSSPNVSDTDPVNADVYCDDCGSYVHHLEDIPYPAEVVVL